MQNKNKPIAKKAIIATDDKSGDFALYDSIIALLLIHLTFVLCMRQGTVVGPSTRPAILITFEKIFLHKVCLGTEMYSRTQI